MLSSRGLGESRGDFREVWGEMWKTLEMKKKKSGGAKRGRGEEMYREILSRVNSSLKSLAKLKIFSFVIPLPPVLI